MALFTQAFRFVSSKRCVFQPIVANASKEISSIRQALPSLKHWALPLVAIHPAASVRLFHTLRVCIPSSRASSPAATHMLRSSVKKESVNVQIAHPCLDSIFHYGFADAEILKDFLNVVLQFDGAQAIEDVTYLSQILPSANPQAKSGIEARSGHQFTVDVRCRTKSGRHFLMEMQNDFRSDYHMKALVEHSRMLSRLDIDQTTSDRSRRTAKNALDKNKFWKGVEGLYTIIVTNKSFPLSTLKSHYFSETVAEPFLVNPYELRHVKQLDRHLGDIPNQVVFLMLDKLKPPHPGQVLTPVERWAQVFQDPALRSGVATIPTTKRIKDVEALAGDVKSIRAFIDRLDVTKLPLHLKDNYDRIVNYNNGAMLDIQEKAIEKGKKIGKKDGMKKGEEIGMKKGEEIGMKKGEEKGMKKGEEKGMKRVVEGMLIEGSTISQIVKITGLSFEFVESLISLKSQGNAD